MPANERAALLAKSSAGCRPDNNENDQYVE